MKRFFHVFCLLFPLFLSAQEVCNNGIDDDGDGLIDLNDSDCSNGGCALPPNMINNPSFESYSSCPNNVSQMSLATGWRMASFQGTSDYFNTCGFMPSGTMSGLTNPPSGSIPHGNGFAGFVDLDNLDIKEYVGTCLNSTMIAGQTYTFSGYLGFGVGGVSSQAPFTLAIFGYDGCNGFPTNPNRACPNNPGWTLIGTVVVSGYDQWVAFSTNITPSINVQSIAIGPTCYYAGSRTNGYYFLDDVAIRPASALSVNLSVSGSVCDGTAVINTSPQALGTSYQWYKDGVAITSNGNNASYTPASGSAGNGNYRCLVSNGGNCALSINQPISTSLPLGVSNPSNAIGCPGSTVNLTATLGYSSYLWSENGGASWVAGTDNFPATHGGTYLVEARQGVHCQNNASIAVTFYNISASASDTDICAGETINLSSSTNFFSWQTPIYVWSPSTSVSNSNIANPSAFPTTDTEYIIVAQASGCIVRDTVQVLVSCILPLDISNLEAKLDAEGNANLYFEASNAKAATSFEIQRSTNKDTNFETVGILPANNTFSSYTFRDKNLLMRNGETYFYRIASRDQNGEMAYSSVVHLVPASSAVFNVYPNPAKHELHIKAATSVSDVAFYLYDLQGKIIIS